MRSDPDEIRKRVQADMARRAAADDPIAAKIKALRCSNLRSRENSRGEPVYRGFSFGVMACAMCAAWTYGNSSGKEGDDFEFWFREYVDEHFVDGQLVNVGPEILACAEFVVEQIMAIANEPYDDRSTSAWAYHDIARLCARLSEVRLRGKDGAADAGGGA